MANLLPTDFGTPAEYSTYTLALADSYPNPKPSMTAFETAEMDASWALVPRAQTTKLFSVVNGNWNTGGNWYPSGVPGTGDRVLVGQGCNCKYNKNDAVTKVHSIRNDGTFEGDVSMSTKLIVDTFINMPTGLFRDGTRTSRVPAGTTHEWMIATSNGLIDVDGTGAFSHTADGDTFMQSRGILSHGQVDMWGAVKTPFVRVAVRTAPNAGATSVALDSAPVGWEVGDKVVFSASRDGGRNYDGQLESYLAHRVDLVTLTSVSGVNIGWTGGLTYDHRGPQALGNGTTYLADWMDTRCYAVNITRNIVIRPDDATAPIHHRGHTMQMHNPAGWSARYVEWRDLGRTAKHGGWHSAIVQSYAGCAANVGLPLSGSQFWDAGSSSIKLGPTFLMRFTFDASGAGSFLITGTDEDGAAQTDTVNYVSGFNSELHNTKYFLAVTEIKGTTAFANRLPYLHLVARARQRSYVSAGVQGVRNLDTGTAVYTTIKNTVNLQGRYPFHWHKMGVTGAILSAPPVLDGCSVNGSPGWGYAQHQTHGHMKNCVAYDCRGAGFVAEDGNESGVWLDCFSVYSLGHGGGSNKDSNDLRNLDPARVGLGFSYTGRLMRVSGCFASGMSLGHGFNTRVGSITLFLDPLQVDHPTAERGATQLQMEHEPLGAFVDCKAMGCSTGANVVKSDPNQAKDLRTVPLRWESWSCSFGLDLTYTGHYSTIDAHALRGFIDGNLEDDESGGVGLETANSNDQAIINAVVEGCTYGITLKHLHTSQYDTAVGVSFTFNTLNGRQIVNPTFIGCTNDYRYFNAEGAAEALNPLVYAIYQGPIPGLDTVYTTGQMTTDALTLTGLTLNGTKLTGTKHDEIGDIPYPYGTDTFSFNYSAMLTAYGYYVDGSNKYVMVDEWFSSRLTGELQKTIYPLDVTAQSLVGKTNRGTTDLSNNTAPVFGNFSVPVAANTNLDVDILARATGSTIRLGGFTRPLKTYIIDNGNGTIKLVPLPDETYTETAYVWVDDVNGNTTRALMTINVGATQWSFTTSKT